jgi:hypothetical protein
VAFGFQPVGAGAVISTLVACTLTHLVVFRPAPLKKESGCWNVHENLQPREEQGPGQLLTLQREGHECRQNPAQRVKVGKGVEHPELTQWSVPATVLT